MLASGQDRGPRCGPGCLQQAATVAAEDSRIRLLVHDAAAVFQPEVIPVPGSQPTLVLTAGSGAYTYHSLVQYGALVLLPHHAGLLLDNVFPPRPRSTPARHDRRRPRCLAQSIPNTPMVNDIIPAVCRRRPPP
jgi:hypothetical protein